MKLTEGALRDIWTALKYLAILLFPRPEEVKNNPIINPPEELAPDTDPPLPEYFWNTPEVARHSVRLICDEEKLTVEQKNTLCATIGAESGWITTAVHKNIVNGRVTSVDYGICQWNNYFHGKEISPEEAVSNPEKAVRLMCSYWRRDQRNLWMAYENGSYKKYL